MCNKKYIQLPLLEDDLSIEAVELIWMFAKMDEKEKKETMDYLEKEMIDDNKCMSGEIKRNNIPENTTVNCDDQMQEFILLIKKLATRLMREACNIASTAYLAHCIEGKTADELDVESEKDREYYRLLMEYFDRHESWPIVIG